MNARYDAKAQKLVIEVDASADSFRDAPPSSTGKTKLLASAGNKISVTTPYGVVTIAVNAMVPNKG